MANRPVLLTVLPAVDSTTSSDCFSGIEAAAGVDLLPVALASTLAFRAQNDEPDVIVIASEVFAATVWRDSDALDEALSRTPVLLLAGEASAALKKRASRLHIGSVLPLDISTEQLLAAIHAMAAGLVVALPPVEEGPTGWQGDDESFGDESFSEHLTARETEVLRLMALGYPNKEIASRLDISGHTAKFHVSSVLGKLGATSRTEAVTIGILRGLVAI